MATVKIGTHEIKLPIGAFRRGSTLVIQSEIQGRVILRLETDSAHEIGAIAEAARMAGGNYAGQVARQGRSSGKVVDRRKGATRKRAVGGGTSEGKRKRGKRG